jgi:hypothetical protein
LVQDVKTAISIAKFKIKNLKFFIVFFLNLQYTTKITLFN